MPALKTAKRERKIIFAIIDGMGSLPVKKGGTEWEITSTPNLDRLMKSGTYGLLYPLGIGAIPGSDTSQLNMLGYPPEKYYCGRGPLEALGASMKLKEGDVAFRTNFATVDERLRVIDRRAGRIDTKTASRIAESIRSINIDGFRFMFKNTVEHRGVLIIRGEGATANVGDTDPHSTGAEVIQPGITKENAKIVRAINKYTAKVHRILSKHKLNRKRKLAANMLLLRGAGMHRRIRPFEKRFGMKACCIAGGALYKGIAKYIGMDVINVKGATGDYNTDLGAKANAALSCIKKYDFVFVHVKAFDNAGHDGNIKKRIELIRKIDKMIGMLAGGDAVIVLAGDHSTPPTKRRHSFEPVPFLIANVEARDYGGRKFCEVECAKGELARVCGEEVMKLITAYAGRAEKYGS